MVRKTLACLLAAVLIACLSVAIGSPPGASPDLESIKVTYYAKGGIPGPPAGNGGGEENGYQLLRGGVKWNLADYPGGVPYLVNLEGAPGGAFAEITAAFEAWDAKTSAELFNNDVGTTDLSGTVNDRVNTVSWAPIADTNIVAQCRIRFYVNTKEIFEFDIVFNSNQPWGIDSDGEGEVHVLTGAFDIRNIATHESGHTLYLGDLYEDNYGQMTMYGYTAYGEVKKISPESGDIKGLHKLYGS
jgi:hypothetical protein